MPSRYVKPYVQRGKSEALDAAAICEAVSRPTVRFAAIKSVGQQAALTLHRAREILVKRETMLANLIRGCLGVRNCCPSGYPADSGAGRHHQRRDRWPPPAACPDRDDGGGRPAQ
jgi:transposase